MMTTALLLALVSFLAMIYQLQAELDPVSSSSSSSSSLPSQWAFPESFHTNPENWRLPGHYDEQLAALTASPQPLAISSINNSSSNSNDKKNVLCLNKNYRARRKSQFAEDVWLYEHWFFGVKEGLTIESGAYQGLAMSNSYMFRSYADWKSVHIEGDPENFKKLVVNRPEAININAALCNESRQLHYLTGGADTTRGFLEFMSEKFIKDWHGSVQQNNLISVQCLPMKDVLRKLQIKHVDIWFLDVEGAEENVLLGTDFSVVTFNAIVMECDNYNRERNHAKQHILKKHHFHCLHLGMTCFCKHESYKPSESPCGFSV